MQSTRTTDPAGALIFKRQFLELKQQEDPDEKVEHLGKLPLSTVTEKYFEWKGANCSHTMVARERRMFKHVLKFFGKNKVVRSIHVQLIPRYQVAMMESNGQSPAATWANLESEFSASIEPKPDLLLFEESATRFRCLP